MSTHIIPSEILKYSEIYLQFYSQRPAKKLFKKPQMDFIISSKHLFTTYDLRKCWSFTHAIPHKDSVKHNAFELVGDCAFSPPPLICRAKFGKNGGGTFYLLTNIDHSREWKIFYTGDKNKILGTPKIKLGWVPPDNKRKSGSSILRNLTKQHFNYKQYVKHSPFFINKRKTFTLHCKKHWKSI